MKGDIVLVRFPFTDQSSDKLRPALALTHFSIDGDMIVAFITTRFDRRANSDVLIPLGEPSSGHTGLKRDSLIRPTKLTTLNKRVLLGRIGTLPTRKLREVDESLRHVLAL